MIKQNLKGKKILLTGVTGFLGTALLERLLAAVDLARIDVVMRGNPAERLKWLLAGSAFGPARKDLGSAKFDELIESKVRGISADISTGAPEIEDDIDIVIHSAATVSFDPPIAESFATNFYGTKRLYEASRGKPFIHISTAYVAGVTRGTQLETPLPKVADPLAEGAFAEHVTAEAELLSRSPEVLEKLESRARAQMGRAGPQSVATRSEQMRKQWVYDRLVRAGRARSRSLGWPDIYTFTKALTEVALDEMAGDNPLTIVRPSIIESALRTPFPGWIEGFRMADPVMLGYGRGAFPEFPGIPEGVLDVIPVDFVVNCIMAVAATPPRRRAIYHVCSGDRNPLNFRQVYETTRSFFVEHPLPERGRGAFKLPEWTFPGRKAVDKKLELADKVLTTAERVVGRLPRNSFARDSARRVDRLRRKYEFAKKYADLYGPYVEAEVIYTDAKAKALHESLPKADRQEFNFDPTSFTWDYYLKEVHLPILTAPLRFPGPARPEPRVNLAHAPANGKIILAAFDVEGTIVDSNVLEAFLWLRLSDVKDVAERARRIAALARRAPKFLKAERRDRGEFLRSFYRQYKGAPVEETKALAKDTLGDLILQRLAPAAVRRIRDHRAMGHRVVFITGTLDFILEPVAPLADLCVTAELAESGGYFTGDMTKPSLVGEARSWWLKDYAGKVGADLANSYAYADSLSDLPMLEAVGNPVAVNPDVALSRLALERKWPVEEWDASKGSGPILMPSMERV